MKLVEAQEVPIQVQLAPSKRPRSFSWILQEKNAPRISGKTEGFLGLKLFYIFFVVDMIFTFETPAQKYSKVLRDYLKRSAMK